jgi:hypothetical protein
MEIFAITDKVITSITMSDNAENMVRLVKGNNYYLLALAVFLINKV